jgi:hypothetical protein
MCRSGQAVVLAVALVLPAVACKSSGREEAAGVMRALDLLRDAPADQKETPTEALARVPCSLPIVCAARDRCAGVYRHMAEAEGRMQSIRERISRDPPKTAQGVADLTAELDRAQAEVNGFARELGGCEEAASLMRRTYGI